MQNSNWNEAQTLEEWFRTQVRIGNHKEALALVKLLPEEKKRRYREIWKEVKGVEPQSK